MIVIALFIRPRSYGKEDVNIHNRSTRDGAMQGGCNTVYHHYYYTTTNMEGLFSNNSSSLATSSITTSYGRSYTLPFSVNAPFTSQTVPPGTSHARSIVALARDALTLIKGVYARSKEASALMEVS